MIQGSLQLDHLGYQAYLKAKTDRYENRFRIKPNKNLKLITYGTQTSDYEMFSLTKQRLDSWFLWSLGLFLQFSCYPVKKQNVQKTCLTRMAYLATARLIVSPPFCALRHSTNIK